MNLTSRECDKCGQSRSIFPIVIRNPKNLVWPVLAVALCYGAVQGIAVWYNSAQQSKLKRQILLKEMPTAWETWYYVLNKVNPTERLDVLREFVARSQGFFKDEQLTSEQLDMFLDLFPREDVPKVMMYIDQNYIFEGRKPT